VLYFGASHVLGGIYLLPDGEEYCGADGALYAQDFIDQYHGIYSCWRCGGCGLIKLYLNQGYEMVVCDICRGSRQSGLMPALQPRHVHSWAPSKDRPPRVFRPRRGFGLLKCACGAVWLKAWPKAGEDIDLAGMKPLSSLLQWERGA
jgi:hypothetical protein